VFIKYEAEVSSRVGGGEREVVDFATARDFKFRVLVGRVKY